MKILIMISIMLLWKVKEQQTVIVPLFFESLFIFLHLFGQLFLVASNLQSSIFLSLHDAGSVGVTSGVGVTFTLEKKETVIRTLID